MSLQSVRQHFFIYYKFHTNLLFSSKIIILDLFSIKILSLDLFTIKVINLDLFTIRSKNTYLKTLCIQDHSYFSMYVLTPVIMF